MRVLTAKGETVSQSTSESSRLSAVPSASEIIAFDTHKERDISEVYSNQQQGDESLLGGGVGSCSVNAPGRCSCPQKSCRPATVSQQMCSFLATACMHVVLKSSTSVSLKPEFLSSSKLFFVKRQMQSF